MLCDTERHMNNQHDSYFKFLGKWLLTVFATYQVLALSILGPLLMLLFFGIVVGAAFGSESTTSAQHTYTTVYGSGSNDLLSIRINGVITGTQPAGSSLFGAASGQTAGYSVKQSLYD